MAIPYESSKLIATDIVNEGSFAELLDRRLKRNAELEAERNGRLIEDKTLNKL